MSVDRNSDAYFKSGEIVWDELTAKGNLTATDEETAREAVLERFPGAAILSMKPLDYEMGWRFTVKLADESGVGASTREDEGAVDAGSVLGKASESGAGSPPQFHTWVCDTCGHRNPRDGFNCEFCNTPPGIDEDEEEANE